MLSLPKHRYRFVVSDCFIKLLASGYRMNKSVFAAKKRNFG